MGQIPSKDEMQGALAERQGRALCETLSKMTVAVCGLGGLGSNIAVLLARAGVGRLILTDFDTVDITNLHRQHYKACQTGMRKTDALAANLLEISPYLSIEAHTARMTEQNCGALLCGADIVCEAFDCAETKAMLAGYVLENMPDTYLIAASGMAGLASANEIRTRKIGTRFYLCGDEVSDVCLGMGLVSSRVMLCAAQQAHMVLRIAAGEYGA